MAKEKRVLSATERLILDSYADTMEALGAYLGEAFEIVLHALDDLDHSVVKIINGFHSGRKEGAPITDLALAMLNKINKHESGPFIAYLSKSKYGKPLKSITTAIFGENKRVIGLLCINMYLDSPLTSILQTCTFSNPVEFIPENFISDSDELIIRALEKTKAEVAENASIPVSQKNKEIVTLLYHQGIFKLKNAARTIATDLGISKSTVYLHIRSLENG